MKEFIRNSMGMSIKREMLGDLKSQMERALHGDGSETELVEVRDSLENVRKSTKGQIPSEDSSRMADMIKELNKVIRTGMGNLQTDIRGIGAGVDNLQTDISGIGAGVDNLQTDISGIGAGVGSIQTGVGQLQEEMTLHESNSKARHSEVVTLITGCFDRAMASIEETKTISEHVREEIRKGFEQLRKNEKIVKIPTLGEAIPRIFATLPSIRAIVCVASLIRSEIEQFLESHEQYKHKYVGFSESRSKILSIIKYGTIANCIDPKNRVKDNIDSSLENAVTAEQKFAQDIFSGLNNLVHGKISNSDAQPMRWGDKKVSYRMYLENTYKFFQQKRMLD